MDSLDLTSQHVNPNLLGNNNASNHSREDAMGGENSAVHDKVNVNVGKGVGGHGMDGALPLVAAAMMNRREGYDGFGGGAAVPAAFGAFIGSLFSRRGGFFGGDDCGPGFVRGGGENSGAAPVERFIAQQTLGDIQKDIATSANETQAVVSATGANSTQMTLQQTIALQNLINQLALADQAGFSNVKDSVQNTGAVLSNQIWNVNSNMLQGQCGINQNVSAQGCMTRETVASDGEKTRALLTSRFQLEDATRINELNARVIELQSEGRRRSDHDDLRLQITNTNTAVAAQAQGQAQAQQQQQGAILASIVPLLNNLIIESQVARATNANLIIGNTGATTTGAQTASPINVR